MKYVQQVGLEALTVGLIFAIMMASAMCAYSGAFDKSLAVIAFAVGAFFHIGCEVSGVNRWYCANGAACRM